MLRIHVVLTLICPREEVEISLKLSTSLCPKAEIGWELRTVLQQWHLGCKWKLSGNRTVGLGKRKSVLGSLGPATASHLGHSLQILTWGGTRRIRETSTSLVQSCFRFIDGGGQHPPRFLHMYNLSKLGPRVLRKRALVSFSTPAWSKYPLGKNEKPPGGTLNYNTTLQL